VHIDAPMLSSSWLRAAWRGAPASTYAPTVKLDDGLGRDDQREKNAVSAHQAGAYWQIRILYPQARTYVAHTQSKGIIALRCSRLSGSFTAQPITLVAYGAAKCVNDTTACNSSVPGSFVITLAKHYAGGFVANLECHANDAKYQLLLTADEMSAVNNTGICITASDTESGVQVRVWVGDRKRAPKLASVLNKASGESRVTPNNLFSTRKVLLQLHEEVTHFCALSNVPDWNTSASRFSSFVSQNASLVSSAFS
jgi:hypothetical protein